MKKWEDYISEINGLLNATAFHSKSKQIAIENGFDIWRNMAIDVRRKKRTLFLVGNGASASMASHFAADLAKNAHLHTQVFSDLALITAISNDLTYENVFSEPLRHSAVKGDMLIAISSSGNSPNIIKAIQTAKRSEVLVVTLSAMKPDNAIRSMGDLNIYISAKTYGSAETCHAAILHYWMDLLEIQ
jgi:D-sedoheptulose 7-phosphate isomerase